MQYTKILKHAWQVTWHNRALWFFGIISSLASFGIIRSRQLGGWRIDINWMQTPEWPLQPIVPSAPAAFQPAAWSFVGNSALSSFYQRPPRLFWLGILAILLVGWVIRLLSQGALIGMVDDVEQRDRTALQVGFKFGWRYLPRLMGLDGILVLVMIVLALLLSLLLVPLVLAGILPLRVLLQPGLLMEGLRLGSVWHVVLTVFIVLLLLVLVALAQVALTMLREVSQRAVVLNDYGAWQAVRTSWKLLWHRLGQFGLMWLIIFSIDLVFSLVTLPLVLLGHLIISLPFGQLLRNTPSVGPAFLVIFILIAVVVLVDALINGVYHAFRSSAWTLTYREVAELPESETS